MSEDAPINLADYQKPQWQNGNPPLGEGMADIVDFSAQAPSGQTQEGSNEEDEFSSIDATNLKNVVCNAACVISMTSGAIFLAHEGQGYLAAMVGFVAGSVTVDSIARVKKDFFSKVS